MEIPDKFHALLRGLASCHLVESQVQFRDLQQHFAPGHENILKAKEVYDEAREFNALMNPQSAEAANSPVAA